MLWVSCGSVVTLPILRRAGVHQLPIAFQRLVTSAESR